MITTTHTQRLKMESDRKETNGGLRCIWWWREVTLTESGFSVVFYSKIYSILIYVHVLIYAGAHGRRKMETDPLELELQAAVT